MAFSARSQRLRVWLFPFDSNSGQLRGKGVALTSVASQAYEPNLSADGKKLAFTVLRGGRWEIWEKLLPDGQEGPIISGDYDVEFPQWSHDGNRLAYRRIRTNSGTLEWQFRLWTQDVRTDEPLTGSQAFGAPYGWWPDDKSLLTSGFHLSDDTADIQRLWLDKVPHIEDTAQIIASRPGYSLWQAHVSPDSRWIVFMGVNPAPSNNGSAIYVTASHGGDWIPLTGANHWTDKPRWSPDGKFIYYVAEKDGFLNIWAIRFDSTRGRPLGRPIQVTAFESPSLMFPSYIEPSDISVASGQIAVTLQETSGSIWMLDDVNH
jgi:Tol biopolymer transport system component